MSRIPATPSSPSSQSQLHQHYGQDMELRDQQYSKVITGLFHVAFVSTYLLCDGHFCEYTGSYGITSISCHSKLLHGILQGTCNGQSHLETQLQEQHSHHLNSLHPNTHD